MNSVTTTNNQAEILGRAIDLHLDQLSPEVAQFIVSLELTENDANRMQELAEQARNDSLSESDQVELEEYRRCGRLIELLKLKARMILAHSGES